MAQPRFPAPTAVPSSGLQNRPGLTEWGNQQQNVQPFGRPNANFLPSPFGGPAPAQQQQQQQTRSPFQTPLDSTAGLTKQMSNYNLQGAAAGGDMSAGYDTYQQQQQQMHPFGSPDVMIEEHPPVRNAEMLYGANILKRAKATNALVSQFFKDSVVRARDRNVRFRDFESVLNDPLRTHEEKVKRAQELQLTEAQYLRFLRTKERPENFSMIKIIGKGAFGEVRLVRRKTDNKVYALKSLLKSEMFKKDQLAHVQSERDVLAECDSPWVVKLHTTFQDPDYLYMLMEFLPGGDLMTMLIKYEIFTLDITRFYMAELILAIEAVHKLHYIHRDIKPDNILLDQGGHIKLTDFGLSTNLYKSDPASRYPQADRGNQSRNSDQIHLTMSQINTWRKNRRQLAYSTVGTPDYIAPEIFTGQGYDKLCDWWSLGTIMYECLVGWAPFCAEKPDETYHKIVRWTTYFHVPHDIQLDHHAENFMRSLICDKSTRLGRHKGAEDLKAHPFFSGVQWDTLRNIKAPFEPKLTSQTDTQYFPTEEINQENVAMQRRAPASQDPLSEMSLPFIGYTYKRFDAFRNS